MVHKLYKLYAHPLARVVRGLPISWEPTVATLRRSDSVWRAAWSPCNRFIAAGLRTRIEILDAATLNRLHTFTHPASEESMWLIFSPDSRSLTQFSRGDYICTTWDLQTGGRTSAIPSTSNPSFPRYFSSAYSMDGKMVAAARFEDSCTAVIVISIYDLLSGTHIYSYAPEERIVASIWTHGESLRFVTVKPRSITIWEIGFTSKHTLTEIGALPAPDVGYRECLFLPNFSRLAFILGEAVLVWDARDSKFLLNFVGSDSPVGLSFSSDGHFFACGARSQEIHLWKESPTGYDLHRKLAPGADIRPHLSPDGESIITYGIDQVQLSRTTDPISPPSSVPTQPAKQTQFVLAFSPDKSFITTGRLGENIATIVDLKSGDPRLIVDTGMKICGLGVTGDTVIVVGEGKIITWNLPAGDRVLDAKANVHDSVRTTAFNHPPPPPKSLLSASISPDFNHFVITRGYWGLEIYDVSTGKHIVSIAKHAPWPWFTRDGREFWCSRAPSDGNRIIRGEGSDIIGLEPVQWLGRPSGGCPWESSHGRSVTDDGWILDSRKKRVMWLPHHWRNSGIYQIWDGRFLALFNPRLPEPIIIELDE